ncbi:MAG: thiol reductant ABC exporter subunit CydD [Anaerolineaceae bacterium]|jgi:thiol reductant ABC exporter CydD subunit
MSTQARLLQLARAARWGVALTILFGLIGGILMLAQARLLTSVINGVFLEQQSLGEVWPLLQMLLVVFFLRAIFIWGQEISANQVAVQVKNNLRDLLLKHIFRLGPAFKQDEESGELVTAALQGVEALDAYFSQYLPQLVLAVMVPLIILVAVFPLDLLSALVLVLTAPLIPVFMMLIGKSSETATKRQFTVLSRMSAYFLDTLQGLTALKLLGQSKTVAQKVSGVSETYRQATMNVLKITFLSALVLELVGTISVAIVAVEVGLRLLAGQMLFSQALFLLVIAPEFYMPLRLLALRYHASATGVTAAKRIFAILDLEPLENDAKLAAAPVVSFDSDRKGGISIAFKDVHFAYPGREQEALQGVTFDIPADTMTVLVGKSGSGKSTVAQLLLKFSEPQGGSILVNGMPLGSIPIAQWRRELAWVSQTPYLYHESILYNLRIAKQDATVEEITTACQRARLQEWIEVLPEGIDTNVSELGTRLSGGEAQRLALARAFLRDAALLILDEPTAHLDPKLEDQLAAATREICKGRTVLIIAHRLTTIQEADQIVVLDNGKVVEEGKHRELLAHNGAYHELIRDFIA